jgi:hypothetical protein
VKKSFIKLLCGCVVLAGMACGAYAVSGGESLITLSYLKETFFPSAVEKGTQAGNAMLQEAYENAKDKLDSLNSGSTSPEEGSYSSSLQGRTWYGGDRVELPTGSGALLLAGAASVTHNGTVIDVTDGVEVASGSALKVGHRYLVGEDTRAKIQIGSGTASLGVEGTYIYQKGSGSASPFYDVASTDWFYDSVAYVYENKLFSGMDEHHFGPYEAMNRAMLMTVLYQMAGAPSDELEAASILSFDDVPNSAWYAPYVKWGAAQGITAGTGPRTFSPEQQVTREQVAALLYSFAGNYLNLELTAGTDLSGYEDLDQVNEWAVEAFAWAVADGVVSSTSTDRLTLSPSKNANRAEVATMLRSFSENNL